MVVRMEIRDQRLFVIHHQHEGLGGYPLGSLEQTLVLMSGGFDSTVAAYQMMRRGLITHFCFSTWVVALTSWALWKWPITCGTSSAARTVYCL